jgi:hypothetical protein
VVITVNGQPLEETGWVEDSLGRSVVRVPRSVRASSDRRRDLGASRANHNRDDDRVAGDGRWNQ